jgi:hypothetical protein
MPFTDLPDNIVATLTDAGRHALARSTAGEIAFQATSFAVGRGGYNMANPVKIVAIDPGNTTLDDQFFPVFPTLQPITDIERPYPQTIVFNCRLASTDAVAGLGEIGIWATYLWSPGNPSEVGTTFLFAAAHFPLSTKTLRQVVVYRVIVQF